MLEIVLFQFFSARHRRDPVVRASWNWNFLGIFFASSQAMIPAG
jgi:hypothetical protein